MGVKHLLVAEAQLVLPCCYCAAPVTISVFISIPYIFYLSYISFNNNKISKY